MDGIISRRIVVTSLDPEITFELPVDPCAGGTWRLQRFNENLLSFLDSHFVPASRPQDAPRGYQAFVFHVPRHAFDGIRQTNITLECRAPNSGEALQQADIQVLIVSLRDLQFAPRGRWRFDTAGAPARAAVSRGGSAHENAGSAVTGAATPGPAGSVQPSSTGTVSIVSSGGEREGAVPASPQPEEVSWWRRGGMEAGYGPYRGDFGAGYGAYPGGMGPGYGPYRGDFGPGYGPYPGGTGGVSGTGGGTGNAGGGAGGGTGSAGGGAAAGGGTQ